MGKILFSRRCIKGVSLLNVFLHLNLTLAPAFLPLVASAQEIKKTKPYVLTSGETAVSVAAKFGLSVSELQKLNQFRTFAMGFSSIGEGSEIDIPVMTSGTEPASVADTSSEVQAATLASQAGSFLQNDPSGDDAVNLARGLATDRVSQEIQAWLGKKGTAKVNLNTDENLSLKGSSLDVLYALSETQNDIFFTQAGIRDADDRTQANFGLGIRHFAPGYMLGGNLFYDHDLSRDHNRLGIGAEYWRDYFKMGANAYLGLSGWKDSPDLDDYEERSANGWDIRAEGYLPAYPQLGGKLTFEQYYGDKVGLFGNSEDDLQKDPYAVTAGVIYTPVPLVSFNADYKTGKGGKDEVTVGGNVNYSFGVPFKDQLNSHAVAYQRTLMGSRYDLVDRNNNIVLEYRKKEVIKLRTAPLVTGQSGERKSLEVAVTAKYGLQEIRWQADSLLAKGGRIVHDGGEDYSVILPPYSADGNNNFFISGIAYDKKGNASSPSETQISVQRAQVSKAKSQFTPAQSYLPADGKTAQILTLLIRDEQNNPVTVSIEQLSLLTDRTGVQVNGKSADASQEEAVVSAFRETAPGSYEVSVKAGVITENITLTPVAEGITLTPAKVFVGGKPAVKDLTIIGTL
ncbi:TPA: inverse autotransporter beta domain-containing protein, partial [Enterobacter kobei]|nr:inverse autotransporter beta domain-containing protein [Enterobacter kobei]